MINNLPDDMLNIIFYLINLKCHTCNVNINNLDKLLESKIIGKKYIFCCEICYNHI